MDVFIADTEDNGYRSMVDVFIADTEDNGYRSMVDVFIADTEDNWYRRMVDVGCAQLLTISTMDIVLSLVCNRHSGQ